MEIYKDGISWIGKILQLSEIQDADRILRAEVVCGKGGRWTGVVRKGDFQEGDLAVVFLPDAIVPNIPALSFMEPHKFRVKMMRLRGCPSEVLIMPHGALDLYGDVGTDVTDVLGVMKYEKEIPSNLAGEMAGMRPPFIPRTDEPNFQIVPEMRKALIDYRCTRTTKFDGSSQSFFHRDGRLGGCSHKRELKDTPQAAVWEIAHRYNLPEKLPSFGNLAIQWECVGPNIQKNPLKLTKVEPRVFDVWDIDNQKYLDHLDALTIAKELDLPFVNTGYLVYQDFSDDELREMAEGIYAESGKQREGIVIRPIQEMSVNGKRLSFKIINLSYKEK